ncbi:MAG: TlyA family RNA methyltransferase [Ruminococcaceae bacterium]|nr:TlyA family RNA methyltransferase [Oscillospiraceae bacterium]
MRLDLYLTSNGYADSRQRAKVLIVGNCVSVNGKLASKPSFDVTDADKVEVSGDPIGYVSRGALKIKAAFEEFNLFAQGKIAIDIGASTGGFTEYLLEQGAAKVYAVDSGSNQLAEKLKNDGRVVSMEKYNARNLQRADFSDNIEFAVMDVSFISQTLIIPSLTQVLAEKAVFVSLIKPQFEAGREAIGKGGIVKNVASRAMAVHKVVDCAKENGFDLFGIIASPIKGGDGNTEYLACFSRGGILPKKDLNIDLLIN